jgi:hypothetical protein
MTIEKRYREVGAEWQKVSEEELVRRCEWGGYFKKGTALSALKDTGHISTPWADFRIVQEVRTA